jgi:hypothetical protein
VRADLPSPLPAAAAFVVTSKNQISFPQDRALAAIDGVDRSVCAVRFFHASLNVERAVGDEGIPFVQVGLLMRR